MAREIWVLWGRLPHMVEPVKLTAGTHAEVNAEWRSRSALEAQGGFTDLEVARWGEPTASMQLEPAHDDAGPCCRGSAWGSDHDRDCFAR